MAWIEQLLLSQLLVFTLVLVRVSGVVMLAPIFVSHEVPARIRALLAVALAVLVTPLQSGSPGGAPQTLVDFALAAVGEGLVGVMLGLGVMLLFAGVQLAGQVVAQVSGMQLADVFNPAFDASVPVFSQLLYLVTLAVFVLIDGHRMVLAALLDTFERLPVGAPLGGDLVDTLATLLTQSCSLGIRAAAPTMVALLLATLVLGLVSRTLPQLNLMAMGFGISAVVTLGGLAVTLSAVAWLFQNEVVALFQQLTAAIHG